MEAMTPEAAAWVREHVWTPGMRSAEEKYPGTWTRCPCQWEACHQCKRGECASCIGTPRRHAEGMIAAKSGTTPACFPKSEPVRVAQVWLADRVCESVCRCGCRGKRPMSPAEATWIREHVWPAALRKQYRESPGGAGAARCACQMGMSAHCHEGRNHGVCHGASPHPSPEAYVTNRRAEVRYFKEPYENEMRWFDQRKFSDSDARVWLADRICRWVCPCTCHQGVEPPSAVEPARPPRYELVPLPGLEAVGR